jgi:pyruvate dehydrogenase E2 component (dihydrolipoamide acetyltransferase)
MPDICMPSLGADMVSGTLLEWKIAVGDRVTRGDVVGLIETEKATMELESFADGVVEALLVEPGAKIPVGTVLARLSAATVAPTWRQLNTPTALPVPSPTCPDHVAGSQLAGRAKARTRAWRRSVGRPRNRAARRDRLLMSSPAAATARKATPRRAPIAAGPCAMRSACDVDRSARSTLLSGSRSA